MRDHRRQGSDDEEYVGGDCNRECNTDGLVSTPVSISNVGTEERRGVDEELVECSKSSGCLLAES